nr:lysine-specific histone demethylase 1 homolog 3 [Tanacetum cinerariifolium]
EGYQGHKRLRQCPPLLDMKTKASTLYKRLRQYEVDAFGISLFSFSLVKTRNSQQMSHPPQSNALPDLYLLISKEGFPLFDTVGGAMMTGMREAVAVKWHYDSERRFNRKEQDSTIALMRSSSCACIGKTVKEKVCVHTNRDIRAIASQVVSVWVEIFRKENVRSSSCYICRGLYKMGYTFKTG